MSAPHLDLDSDVRLRPVIELSPASFGPCPDLGPGPWTPEQQALYWRTGLAGSGMVDLDPIQPGCWFVWTSDIGAPFPLSKILEVHLEDAGSPLDLEEVSAFAGGFALCHEEEPILLPSCCGDLGNLADWGKAAAQRSDAPEMLWVGHPWFSTWFAEGWLHVREEPESPTPTAPPTVRLRPAALESAIAEAERELDRFRDKLLVVLHAMPCSAPPDEIAKRLIGR